MAPPDWTPPALIGTGVDGVVHHDGPPRTRNKRRESSVFKPFLQRCRQDILKDRTEVRKRNGRLNFLRLSQRPIYGANVLDLLSVSHAPHLVPRKTSHRRQAKDTDDQKEPIDGSVSELDLGVPTPLLNAVKPPIQRMKGMIGEITNFTFLHPTARAPPIGLSTGVFADGESLKSEEFEAKQALQLTKHFKGPSDFLYPARTRLQINFPTKKRSLWGSGKLAALERILRQERQAGRRCLVFTQMTKMLDVLEDFMRLHHYKYLRLDGTTTPQKRLELAEKFNVQPEWVTVIMTTRAASPGLDLNRADRVVFYETDWNPAMDLEAENLVNRIAHVRDLVVTKLVSSDTVEENILRKQEQKRKLNAHVQYGSFKSDTIQASDPRKLLGIVKEGEEEEKTVTLKEVEAAMQLAEDPVDRSDLRRARRQQQNRAWEFQEENPVSEAQELESRASKLELYAASFFGDEPNQRSAEEIGRRKRSVLARSSYHEVHA